MKNEATYQKGFYAFLILITIWGLRGLGVIKAIGYVILIIAISTVVVNMIGFIQIIKECKGFEEIYQSIKEADGYRYQSHFISERKLREEEVKGWNDYINGVGSVLIRGAEDFLQNSKIPKKREKRLREMIIETKKIITT